MAKIEPILKSESIDYGNVEMKDFWLKRNGITASSIKEPNQSTHSKIKELIDLAKNGIICVQSENLSDSSLIQDLFNAADRGNRIYLLTNVRPPKDAIGQLAGRCLMRYGLKNIGSFVLINPNTDNPDGILYTGQFTEAGIQFPCNLLFKLDAEQTEVLYRHFSRHFWYAAGKEIVDANGREHDAGDAPIDVFPCTGNFCDSEYVKNTLNSLTEGVSILTGSIGSKAYVDFKRLNNSTVITSLSGNNNDLIPSIKERGNTLLAMEKGNFLNVFIGSSGCWVIPKTIITQDDIFYALKLNENQYSQVAQLMDGYKAAADYEFTGIEKRGKVSEKTILYLGKDQKEALTIKEFIEKNLGDQPQKTLLPLNEFDNFEPEFKDEDNAVKVEYTWRTLPFYLPESNNEHPLYGRWETENKKITAMLDSILNKIDITEKNESNLAKRLVRFFLGKKQKFSEYRRQIDELKTVNFGRLQPNELKEKIDGINAIHQKVIGEAAEIAEENRKAKIEEEIEKLKEEIKTK
ncbi:MAG: hypothetical protein LBQ88_15700 [Treponema sp.]|jgi:hypothetical protein|nr:hypothetical protein [Treponema sp.]